MKINPLTNQPVYSTEPMYRGSYNRINWFGEEEIDEDKKPFGFARALKEAEDEKISKG